MNITKDILKHYKKVDPTIYAYISQVNYSEWFGEQNYKYDQNDYFRSLCREIVGQQLSGKAANSIFKKFESLFQNKPITPKTVSQLNHDQLRGAGLSNAKAKYIQNLALGVINNELSLDKFENMSDDEIINQLVKVKGIGNWTAEMFLIFTLYREDVFSHGDLGLRKGISKVYKIENPTLKQITEITNRWKPYRTYGTIALWQSLET